MVKTGVKVYVRTRPTAQTYDGFKVVDGNSIQINIPKSEAAGLVNNQQSDWQFKFDSVFENTSQEMLYTSVAHDVVDSLLSGYNGTCFCYGQTGAGKTFTMSGDLRHYQHRGIIPRAIHHTFREIDMRVDKIYKVHVSYLEIYNDQMYDLLSDNPASSETLAIVEDSHSGTYVRGLTKLPVRSEEEALASYFAGDQGRTSSSHVLNSSSSRSHCVFTIHLEMRHSEAASERAVLSKLNLVDLAGSERTKKTHVTGQQMKEAQFINKSLSFLEQTVNALCKKEAYVPFRQTKLTSMLRDALGGNCKTVMVANIYAEPNHMDETLSTLRFATRVKSLVTDLAMMESNDPALLIKRYERQITELKQELALRDTLSGRGRVIYDDLTDAEIRELNQLSMKFLNGDADLEQLPTETLKKIRETFKQMRNVFQSVTSELKEQAAIASTHAGAATASVSNNMVDDGPAGTVGDSEPGGGGGFGIGQAPTDARPPVRGSTEGGSVGGSKGDSAVGAGTKGSGAAAATGGMGTTGVLPGVLYQGTERNTAFSRFKKEAEDGKALNAAVTLQTAELKTLKTSIKDLSLSVNNCKKAIDALVARIDTKKAGSNLANSEVLDSEQYAMLQELKGAKAKYREDFDKLKELRSQLEPTTQALGEAKQALVDAFSKFMGTPQGTFLLSQGLGDEDDGELDANEAFERMQANRINQVDPDSGAYHAAMRKTQARPVKK